MKKQFSKVEFSASDTFLFTYFQYRINIPMEVAIKSQTASILSAHESCLIFFPVDLIQSCSKGVK